MTLDLEPAALAALPGHRLVAMIVALRQEVARLRTLLEAR